MRTLVGHTSIVFSLEVVFPNKLASGSLDNTIKIWDINSGECMRTLVGHSDKVSSVELVSSKILASGSDDDTIRIWNLDSGECFRTINGTTITISPYASEKKIRLIN